MWPEDNLNINYSIRRANNGFVVQWYGRDDGRNFEYVFTTREEALAFLAHQLGEQNNGDQEEGL